MTLGTVRSAGTVWNAGTVWSAGTTWSAGTVWRASGPPRGTWPWGAGPLRWPHLFELLELLGREDLLEFRLDLGLQVGHLL